MAAVILTDAEMSVRDQVGTVALLQAKIFVRSGKVQLAPSDPSSGVVQGWVRDGEVTHEAHAVVSYPPDGSLEIDEAGCDCGVELCSHVAAVILAHDEAHDEARGPAPSRRRSAKKVANRKPDVSPAPPPPAPWELALKAVLNEEPSTNRAPTAPPPNAPAAKAQQPVALQFEVLEGSGLRLAVRLVSPGRSSGWLRSALSWTSLAYPDHYLREVPRQQLRLLRELHALSAARDTLYRDKMLMLDSVLSRRVWDLLREAQEAGVPLVMAGRAAEPVQLIDTPVTARLLVRRQAEGLVVQAVLESGGQRVSGDYLPIANPPHGVAWQPGPGDALSLAPLAAAPSPLFWQLSHQEIPPIPEADEARFLSEFYPQLARHVEVVSPDGSLALPEAQPPVLQLTLTPLGEHRMRLEWRWAYALGASSRHEPLEVPLGRPPLGRDLRAETRTLAEIGPALAAFPGLTQSVGGRTLPAPLSTVEGLNTARLMSHLIPELRDRPDVDVRLAADEAEIPDYRQVDTAPVVQFAPTSTAGPGESDWFDLAVTLSIEGHDIPFNQLFVALAQGDEELLLANGMWFRLDREEFRRLAALIAESREMLDAPAGTVRLSRFHASAWDELEELGIVNGQVESWKNAIQALGTNAERPDVKPPAGLDAILRPYQEDGFRWLATLFEHHLGGVLADDMGLGKTVQTLALFQHVREQGLSDRPFLVLAPTSVVPNWAQEAARFTPELTAVTVAATHARRGHDLAEAVHGADLVITSYTLFRLEFEQYNEIEWAGLVLDEAQAVKNHHSTAYRSARELRTGFKLAITGTPMENNLMELWSLFSITSPGLFPRPDRFTEHYRTPIEREQDQERLQRLRRRIAPLMLRRNKELVAADLPARQEQTVELELLPRHRKIYQKYLQRERQKVLGLLGDLNRNRFEIFRSLTLLRQATLDVSLIDPAHEGVPSTKLDALLEQLSDIAAEGHRVLVFSQFTGFLGRAAARLDQAGLAYSYLDGKTRNRARVISQFREGTDPVFLISLKAGGSGLNLTEADYVFLLDPWWNPAVEAQAVDRAHRIGQTRNVMVYRLVAKDTIEEKVMALKARKRALTDSVLDGDEMSSSVLTADDIRNLLD